MRALGRTARMRAPSMAEALAVPALWSRFRAWLTVPRGLGLALAVLFVLRNSILMVVPGAGAATTAAAYLTLLVGLGYVLADRWEPVWPGLLFGGACMVGTLFSVAPATSMPKGGGWLLLMLAAGPLLAGPRSRGIRFGIWTGIRWLTLAIGVLSAAWWLLRLPNLGRGVFSGVMTHANGVGPMAALGLVTGVATALGSRGWRAALWWGAAAACLMPCVASASRISLVGAGVGVLVVLAIRWRTLSRHLVTVVLAVVVMALGGAGFVMQSEFASSLSEGVLEKGMQNTRGELWDARLAEFAASPWIGVGIGYGEGAGVKVADDGSFNIEPGSSYLALLSMTGALGALTLLGLVAYLCARLAKLAAAGPLPPALPGLLGAGALLLTHGIAEGWVLAVGSPLCLIFWALFGHLLDRAQAGAAPARRRRRTRRRRTA